MFFQLKLWVFCCLSVSVFATSQVPDYLIYQGDTLPIHSNPLEAYFEQIGKRNLPHNFQPCYSTACWRAYVAFWELRNDSLFLKRITNCAKYDCSPNAPANLQQMFGKAYKNGAVFAQWVSFEVLNPNGKQIKYIHQGYDSIYAFERGFVFEGGILKTLNHYDNSRSKQGVFAENPDSLSRFLSTTINWNLLDTTKLSHKRLYVSFYVNSLGKPVNIVIIRGATHTPFDTAVIRAIALLPEWEVYFKRGKPIPIKWTLPIVLNPSTYEKKLQKSK